MYKMDQIDKDILNIIQEQLPLSTRPYLALGDKLNLPEQEVMERLRRLKGMGLIRRIGAVFDSRKMGYYSTLCACQVPVDQIERVADIINRERGVTHNYLRDHCLNLWFTLTVHDEEEARRILGSLEAQTGMKIEIMPAQKIYKIKVSFEMGGTDVL